MTVWPGDSHASPQAALRRALQAVRSLPPHRRAAAALAWAKDWKRHARPEQLPPPGKWRTWLISAGRGWGKTRTGAELVRDWAESSARRRSPEHIALVARTAADARDVMVEGVSGILAVSHPHHRPIYQPSMRRLTWPDGTTATTYSAEEGSQLRGPQHHRAWADEAAAWGDEPDAWTQLIFGLRLGRDPQLVVTTTPRPTRLIKDLFISAKDPLSGVFLRTGKTSDNAANLAAPFLDEIRRIYGGTRIGRQEEEGELLLDTPGALWTQDLVERSRIPAADAQRLTFSRVVVAIDPQAAEGEQSAETGIVCVGLVGDARTGYAVVLDDATLSGGPTVWARRTLALAQVRRADRIVAEVNNGGDMVISTLRAEDPNAPLRSLHASRGKEARAEPVVALCEQGRVRFGGAFPDLERQLTGWVPGKGRSPDRLDAMVWAVTDLMLSSTIYKAPAFDLPGLKRQL